MKLKPYHSPFYIVFQIFIIIGALAVFSLLLFGLEYLFKLDFDKNPETPAISMLLMIVVLNVRFFIKYIGKNKHLQVADNHIIISSNNYTKVIAKVKISPNIFEKKHLIYSHRYGRYSFPVLAIDFKNGQTINIVGMGHTFQWNEETPEIKKPNFTLNMNQWNELIQKIGNF